MIFYQSAILIGSFLAAASPKDPINRYDRGIINQLASTLFNHYNDPRAHFPTINVDGVVPPRKISIIFLKPALWHHTESLVKHCRKHKKNIAYWDNWLTFIRNIKRLGAKISAKEKLLEEYKTTLAEGTKNPFATGLFDGEARNLLEEEIQSLNSEILSLKTQAQQDLLEEYKKLEAFIPLNDSETSLTQHLKENQIKLSLFSYPKPIISNDQDPSEERRCIVIEKLFDDVPHPYESWISQGVDAVYIIEEASFHDVKEIGDLQVIKTDRIKIHREYTHTERPGTRVERVSLIMNETLRIVNQELDPNKPSVFDVALKTLKEGWF